MTADRQMGGKRGHKDVPAERAIIAAWLRDAREAAGRTQREAGNYLDQPSQTISNWETGRYPVDAEDLLRVLRFYGADLVLRLPVNRLPGEPPAKDLQRARERQRPGRRTG